jgi:hypothetical protein
MNRINCYDTATSGRPLDAVHLQYTLGNFRTFSALSFIVELERAE